MSILFESDWLKYPNAIIHYETKNKTFIRVAEIYHQMGISNCCFHLSLLDPTLKDVDPHDPDLSLEMQRRVIRECKRNFWYYAREVMKVDAASGLDGVPFRANRANIAVFWLYLNHVTFILTVIRQTGKTTTMKVIYSWLLNCGITGATLGLVTKDGALKAETMGNIKDQFDYLPPYLNRSTKKDIMNSDGIYVTSTNNKLLPWVSNTSPKLAYKVARGFPIGTLGWDEVAFIENVEIAMSSATFSGNAAKADLKSKGLPHGTMMFTTAGDIDNRDGNFIYRIVNRSTLFSEIFYDCKDSEDLTECILANSRAREEKERKPIVVIDMSFRQMGFDEQWMKEKLIDNSLATEASIDRDLFNVWVSGSSESPLSEADLKRIREHEQEEVWREIYKPYNFLLRWYVNKEVLQRKIDDNHGFIIGVDTSDGAGRDSISFYMRDSVTGEILCGALFNDINLITVADFFCSFLIKYDNSVMVIERKSSAITIIDYMFRILCSKGINPFKRMFNMIFHNKELYPKEFEEIWRYRGNDHEFYTKYKKHVGFLTSASGVTARSELFSTVLLNMVKYTGHLLKDKILVGQLLALVIRNNRVDHPVGGHDDAVIGALLTYWLMMMGKNLSLYGLEPNMILKKNDVYLENKFSIDKDKNEIRKMEKIEEQINTLIEQLKVEKNQILINKIERQIKFLYRDVSPEYNIVTVEDLIETIRKEKKMKMSR